MSEQAMQNVLSSVGTAMKELKEVGKLALALSGDKGGKATFFVGLCSDPDKAEAYKRAWESVDPPEDDEDDDRCFDDHCYECGELDELEEAYDV